MHTSTVWISTKNNAIERKDFITVVQSDNLFKPNENSNQEFKYKETAGSFPSQLVTTYPVVQIITCGFL